MPTNEHKQHELNILLQDHQNAVKQYRETKEAREKRLREASLIHVTCMDERDRFAPDATGEPFGSLHLFASPGGCLTQDRDAVNGANKFIEIYGNEIVKAQQANRQVIIYLMPHTCHADKEAGCAAFGSDEEAELAYFSALAEGLNKRPELQGSEIHTHMYDTDTHDLVPFHGDELLESQELAAEHLRKDMGEASNEEEGEWDRFHAGYRIYVGDRPHAWCPRRDVSYHLHHQMDPEELLEAIALAIKIIKTHSHVHCDEHPIVIQIDKHPETNAAITLNDQKLLKRLNQSPLLASANVTLNADDLLVIRTETDPNTWEGQIIQR